MQNLLHKLIDLKWRKEFECDNTLNQFRQLLERSYVTGCKSFSQTMTIWIVFVFQWLT